LPSLPSLPSPFSFLVSLFPSSTTIANDVLLTLPNLFIGSAVVAVATFTVRAAYSRLVLTVEIDSRDPSHDAILDHLAGLCAPRVVSLRTRSEEGGRPGPGEQAVVVLTPGSGIHTVWLERLRPILVSRPHTATGTPTSSNTSTTSSTSTSPTSTLKLYIPLGSRAALERLVRDARAAEAERDKARTVVYSGDQYGAWRKTRSRPRRHPSSVVLEEGLAEDLIADARSFLASELWYAQRGIPYRRGYLFHGPPGSGKTSFLTVMAGELGLDVYVISLGNPLITDDILADLMRGVPSRCLVLIEDVDVDCAAVTVPGLLNAIDGVAAQEGRLLVLTTNHPEKLPDSLTRAGRIDRKVLFGPATPPQARKLFLHFYDATTSSAEELRPLALAFESLLAKRLGEKLSMADLQGHLMTYKNDPKEALSHF
jgi:chaperone BCS1